MGENIANWWIPQNTQTHTHVRIHINIQQWDHTKIAWSVRYFFIWCAFVVGIVGIFIFFSGFSSPNWYDDLFSQFGNCNSVFRLQCTESDGYAWVSRFCAIAVLRFLLVSVYLSWFLCAFIIGSFYDHQLTKHFFSICAADTFVILKTVNAKIQRPQKCVS